MKYKKIMSRALIVPIIALAMHGSGKNLETKIKEPVKQEQQIFEQESNQILQRYLDFGKGLKEIFLEYSRIKKKTINEDFLKDSNQVLLARMLYGEARGKSFVEKIAIAFTAINRANDGKNYNGEGLKESILVPEQYSCFNKSDPNFEKVRNPENDEPREWEKCLTLAKKILEGKYDGYNFGQTHYHRKDKKPFWKDDMKEKINSKGLAHQFYRGV